MVLCCSKWRLWSKILHLAIHYNCWYWLSNGRRQFALCSWRFVTACQQFGKEEHPCACGRIPDLFGRKLNNKKPQRENCAVWCFKSWLISHEILRLDCYSSQISCTLVVQECIHHLLEVISLVLAMLFWLDRWKHKLQELSYKQRVFRVLRRWILTSGDK